VRCRPAWNASASCERPASSRLRRISAPGGFIDPSNFRSRVWDRLVRKALGKTRDVTPHTLRHTFASLHLAAGTNIKWIQRQGGWATAQMVLDRYGHFIPDTTERYADRIAGTIPQIGAAAGASPNVTRRHQLAGGRGSAAAAPSRNISKRSPLPGANARTRTGDLLITNQLLYRLSYVGWSLEDGGPPERRGS